MSTTSTSTLRFAKSKQGAGNRRRPRVPSSVIVTLLIAAVTVWLAPAFTRQWDDRQAARDLKARLAEDGVVSAFKTIHVGAGLAQGDGRYDEIVARWKEQALRIETKAKAYFANSTAEEDWWNADASVSYFLFASDDLAKIRIEASYLDPRDRLHHIASRIAGDLDGLAPTADDRDRVTRLLASDKPNEFAEGMEQVKKWALGAVETAADGLLSAHPSGYSTTRRDLLSDLLP